MYTCDILLIRKGKGVCMYADEEKEKFIESNEAIFISFANLFANRDF